MVFFPIIYLTHTFPFCYVTLNIFSCIFVKTFLFFLSLDFIYYLSAHSMAVYGIIF